MQRRLTLALSFSILFLGASAHAQVPPLPIPGDPDAASDQFIGRPGSVQPIRAPEIPRHPFMAANDRNNIHDDAYMTDTARPSGPLGRSPDVASTFQIADCASVTFDRRGRIVTICVGLDGPRLMMLDPGTLETLAGFPLPPRSGSGGGSIFTDFTGGGYFYLDHRDRAVVPTNTKQIWVVKTSDESGAPGFQLERIYDLDGSVGPQDAIVSALPDWSGRIWFVTRNGVVGVVTPRSGDVHSIRLEDEPINNSFATDETGGVFIVSEKALYRFEAGHRGRPVAGWRLTYDRGERLKPGQANFGSGTTPTLFGRYVAVTDNADPRMHVLVYKRDEGVRGPRLVCKEPVFAEGKSATDNSLIAVNRSVVVENNYGYEGPTTTEGGGTTAPGITRIDLDEDGRGCHSVWTSTERSPTVVPKLSLGNGLVYIYTKPEGDTEDPWYLTAIDFRTGDTVYKILTGNGLGHNNNYAPVTIGPDGSAYVGVLGGLVRIKDGLP